MPTTSPDASVRRVAPSKREAIRVADAPLRETEPASVETSTTDIPAPTARPHPSAALLARLEGIDAIRFRRVKDVQALATSQTATAATGMIVDQVALTVRPSLERHLRHAASAAPGLEHLLHELLRLRELVEQTVHFLDAGA